MAMMMAKPDSPLRPAALHAEESKRVSIPILIKAQKSAAGPLQPQQLQRYKIR